MIVDQPSTVYRSRSPPTTASSCAKLGWTLIHEDFVARIPPAHRFAQSLGPVQFAFRRVFERISTPSQVRDARIGSNAGLSAPPSSPLGPHRS